MTTQSSPQSRLFGVYIRRGQVLTIRIPANHPLAPETEHHSEKMFFQLPGCVVKDTSRSPDDVLGDALMELTTNSVSAYSVWNSFHQAGQWCYVILDRFPETADPIREGLPRLEWLPLQDWQNNTSLCPELREVLSLVTAQAGNIYTPVRTVTGINTLAHMATGEVLHGQEGPMEEAWKLYIEPLGLLEHEGELTVYDLGLGAGTLVVAARQAWLQNPKLQHLRIVSFDLEKLGIENMLRSLDDFEYAKAHRNFLAGMYECDSYTETNEEGRTLSWNFVEGDFRETIKIPQQHLAQRVFFDFFSMRSHPQLWQLEVMEALFKNCAPDVLLSTYASATSIRANLAAAGFFLGFGIPSGKKGRTTMAARKLELLAEPLPAQWLQTFLRSQLPHVHGETEECKATIKARLLTHPQFS